MLRLTGGGKNQKKSMLDKEKRLLRSGVIKQIKIFQANFSNVDNFSYKSGLLWPNPKIPKPKYPNPKYPSRKYPKSQNTQIPNTQSPKIPKAKIPKVPKYPRPKYPRLKQQYQLNK